MPEPTGDDVAPPPPDEVLQLRRELALLRTRVRRLEHDLASVQPLVEKVRSLGPWDFVPYGVAPDGDWIAVDRTRAEELLAALALIDHWVPWRTRIEPRPR
jgi:hypothetical protein